jgi:hypothetical protein
MSNPRTPRQEESWILSGRRWPDWKKPGDRTAPARTVAEPPNPMGAARPSWSARTEFHRELHGGDQ